MLYAGTDPESYITKYTSIRRQSPRAGGRAPPVRSPEFEPDSAPCPAPFARNTRASFSRIAPGGDPETISKTVLRKARRTKTNASGIVQGSGPSNIKAQTADKSLHMTNSPFF